MLGDPAIKNIFIATTTLMNQTFKIVPVSVADISRVAVFLATHTPDKYDSQKWKNILEWMWLSNPHTETGSAKFGWGIEDSGGAIRGFIGNIPVQYVSAGALYPAIWGTSWYVDEGAKDWSLKLYINFTKQTQILLSNSQTERVEIIMKKLGFVELPAQWFKSTYLFPLHVFSLAFLQNIIAEFSLKKSAAAVFGMALKIGQFVNPLRWTSGRADHKIIVKRIADFPENTDAWFEEFKQHQDCTMVRDRKTYEWLFCNHGSQKDFLIYQIQYENKLHGFLIFKYKSIKGIQYIEIIDEAVLYLPSITWRRIYSSVLSKIYQEAGTANFLLLKSNMTDNNRFFRQLLGFEMKHAGKGYIKSVIIKPDISRSTFTSVDGDIVFF